MLSEGCGDGHGGGVPGELDVPDPDLVRADVEGAVVAPGAGVGGVGAAEHTLGTAVLGGAGQDALVPVLQELLLHLLHLLGQVVPEALDGRELFKESLLRVLEN